MLDGTDIDIENLLNAKLASQFSLSLEVNCMSHEYIIQTLQQLN